VSFPENLSQRPPALPGGVADSSPTSFVGKLRQTRNEALARNTDPWHLRLERVRGKVGDDGIERVSTQAVFDFLEVPQRSRTAGACRRLAHLMRELGWSPIKARGLTQSGFRDQVRGYARDKTGASAF
jgi:hypothetical protein